MNSTDLPAGAELRDFLSCPIPSSKSSTGAKAKRKTRSVRRSARRTPAIPH